jgi:type I restriction enzyme M protein
VLKKNPSTTTPPCSSTPAASSSAAAIRTGSRAPASKKKLDAFIARKDIDHFARLVNNGEIAENGYNIAVSSYVEQEDTREAVDIRALNAEITRIVARQTELRKQIDVIVADLEGEES